MRRNAAQTSRPGDDAPQAAIVDVSATTNTPITAHPCQAQGVHPSRSGRTRNQIGLFTVFSSLLGPLRGRELLQGGQPGVGVHHAVLNGG